jgi:hypothetical protein
VPRPFFLFRFDGNLRQLPDLSQRRNFKLPATITSKRLTGLLSPNLMLETAFAFKEILLTHDF